MIQESRSLCVDSCTNYFDKGNMCNVISKRKRKRMRERGGGEITLYCVSVNN